MTRRAIMTEKALNITAGSAAEAENAVRKAERVLVSCHANPDGDAFGSLAALGHICLTLGKDVRFLCQSRTPEHLAWLELPAQLTHSFAELGAWIPDLLVCLDCADAFRGGPDLEEFFYGKRLPGWEGVASLNIDHHLGNPAFAGVNWVEPEAGATAELVGRLAESLGMRLEGPLGEAVYLGLNSDSGGFTYSSTTPSLIGMASRIVSQGLKVEEFTDKSENNWSLGRMQLWGEVLQNISTSADGRIASVIITGKLLKKHNCSASALEGLVSFLRRLEGVKASILVREKNGGSKVSLRAMGGADSVDVRSVAELFGGGGHKAAAGIDMKLPPDEAARAVLEELEKAL